LILGNPIAVGCLLFQRAFWAFSTSDPAKTIRTEFPQHLYLQGGIALIMSVLALVFAQWFFNKFDERIAEQI
jgi:ABC-2 type transport system permease protein